VGNAAPAAKRTAIKDVISDWIDAII
jgi:hypothetical protein